VLYAISRIKISTECVNLLSLLNAGKAENVSRNPIKSHCKSLLDPGSVKALSGITVPGLVEKVQFIETPYNGCFLRRKHKIVCFLRNYKRTDRGKLSNKLWNMSDSCNAILEFIFVFKELFNVTSCSLEIS